MYLSGRISLLSLQSSKPSLLFYIVYKYTLSIVGIHQRRKTILTTLITDGVEAADDDELASESHASNPSSDDSISIGD